MGKLDPFTRRRLIRFVESFREGSGQLPTLRDFQENGFDGDQIKQALKDKIIEEFYLTLTNGSIVKGFKLGDAVFA